MAVCASHLSPWDCKLSWVAEELGLRIRQAHVLGHSVSVIPMKELSVRRKSSVESGREMMASRVESI